MWRGSPAWVLWGEWGESSRIAETAAWKSLTSKVEDPKSGGGEVSKDAAYFYPDSIIFIGVPLSLPLGHAIIRISFHNSGLIFYTLTRLFISRCIVYLHCIYSFYLSKYVRFTFTNRHIPCNIHLLPPFIFKTRFTTWYSTISLCKLEIRYIMYSSRYKGSIWCELYTDISNRYF